ncbi:MAG: type 11 methyltransferase [Candidatus Kuenenia stuttgartiensis]|nr:MAG: type 11 methyltransferase [Candidatus Kuenenia stuttgartiensis]
MRAVISVLPEWVKKPLRCLKDILKSVTCYLRNIVTAVYCYGEGRLCPVCGKSSRRFAKFGIVPREEAQCVHCGALERHRLLWLFVSEKTDLFNGKSKKMLHVAPEQCFESRFRDLLGDNYLTADLFNRCARIKMDITNIQYPDQSFDVIYCSHVLEHVDDDKQAMREFFRVLKNSGWAILLVPVTSEKTYEDPSIIEPAKRLKAFGQEDHVRRYGSDYVDRLREAGFIVKVTNVSDLVNGD